MAKRLLGLVALALAAAGCSGPSRDAASSIASTTSTTQVLADGHYCGTVTAVDVAGSTFRFRAYAEGVPPGPVVELSGLETVVTPALIAFTSASGIGGPPASSPTLTMTQGYLQLLLQAMNGQPSMTYDVSVEGGQAVSVRAHEAGYVRAGATYYKGCLIHH